MALSNELAEAGHNPKSVDAQAEVTFEITDSGPAITGIKLIAVANVPGIDNDTFQQFAERAKEGCPVSKALAGTNITLNATLK
ncbi:MAG: OsmC family peroxiredoxin [Gracilimonas sp.]|nr:OsmC family peroxiredoxin [Gracilimonas sp.]